MGEHEPKQEKTQGASRRINRDYTERERERERQRETHRRRKRIGRETEREETKRKEKRPRTQIARIAYFRYRDHTLAL
jgi:hypothetical protein